MNRRVIFVVVVVLIGLTSSDLDARKSKEKLPMDLGRTVVVVNDQSTMLVNNEESKFVTRGLPVVFDLTRQSPGLVKVVSWIGLRADRGLTDQLHESCSDFSLKRTMEGDLKAGLDKLETVQVVDSPEVRAVIARADIKLPVKVADTYTDAVENSSHYEYDNLVPWFRQVTAELKDRDLADTLILENVLLWGVLKGGEKCENQDEANRGQRFWETGSLANALRDNCSIALIVMEFTFYDLKNDKPLFSKMNFYQYNEGDLNTDQFLAGEAFQFKRYTRCMSQWHTGNLGLLINREPLDTHFDCGEVTGL